MLNLKTRLKRIKEYCYNQNIKISINDIRKVFDLINSNYDIDLISNNLNLPKDVIFKILKTFRNTNINNNRTNNNYNTNINIQDVKNKDINSNYNKNNSNYKSNTIINNILDNKEYEVLNKDEKQFFKYISSMRKHLTIHFSELSCRALSHITDVKLERASAQQLAWIASVSLDKFQILTGGLTANIGLELSDSELSQRLKILESERDLLSRKLTLTQAEQVITAAQVQDVPVHQEQEAMEEVKAI